MSAELAASADARPSEGLGVGTLSVSIRPALRRGRWASRVGE